MEDSFETSRHRNYSIIDMDKPIKDKVDESIGDNKGLTIAPTDLNPGTI